MTVPRIFVVTGANKGLGKAIVKVLLQDEQEKLVYLTSRDVERGQNAVKDLEEQGLHPLYHQLDITDIKSIVDFRDHLVAKHGGLDVLVNNAGIAYKVNSTVPFGEQAKETVNTDFFGTLNVCNTLFPILKKDARVVNITAQTMEKVYQNLSDQLQEKFFDFQLTMQVLEDLMSQFVKDAQDDKLTEKGWVKHAYGTAKFGVTLMTELLQIAWDENCPDKEILVNSCCPGTVDTDMTGGKEKYPHAISPDEAADTPFYLATLENGMDLKGNFLIKREVQEFPIS